MEPSLPGADGATTPEGVRGPLSQLFASRTLTFNDIESACPAMREALERARTAAGYDIEVLLSGETGTGKNLIAVAIHNASDRRRGPFIWVNAAAIPEHLAESELFGHERGAFTGATGERRGYLELAHGGTLFLDEIGSAPPYVQSKLLTALEHGSFFRVGGNQEVTVDFRLVAATNLDLRREIGKGGFREDLYFRMARIAIAIPPLRERRDDILPLARRFLAEDNFRFTRSIEGFTPECEARLLSYSWPGNVRQLRGVISNAVCMSRGPSLGIHDVFPLAAGVPSREIPLEPGAPAPDGEDLGLSLDEVERRHIERVLRVQSGNIKRAAEVLRISRQTLYGKLKSYGLSGVAEEHGGGS